MNGTFRTHFIFYKKYCAEQWLGNQYIVIAGYTIAFARLVRLGYMYIHRRMKKYGNSVTNLFLFIHNFKQVHH